ncbi:MAG: hypothetical protein PF795_11905, partial [Kiritimatiellae bacterium]|nr:hypothetical protein [Kiritimatiellia bacterium]
MWKINGYKIISLLPLLQNCAKNASTQDTRFADQPVGFCRVSCFKFGWVRARPIFNVVGTSLMGFESLKGFFNVAQG